MTKKDQKKAKNKDPGKSLKKEKASRGKKAKKGKIPGSVKALSKEIKRLTRALRAREEEILALKGAPDDEPSPVAQPDPAGSASPWAVAGSVSERKKSWERHQYLRARYEHHLESGQGRDLARAAADRDLRKRYGDEAGYTEEELEGILS